MIHTARVTSPNTLMTIAALLGLAEIATDECFLIKYGSFIPVVSSLYVLANVLPYTVYMKEESLLKRGICTIAYMPNTCPTDNTMHTRDGYHTNHNHISASINKHLSNLMFLICSTERQQ